MAQGDISTVLESVFIDFRRAAPKVFVTGTVVRTIEDSDAAKLAAGTFEGTVEYESKAALAGKTMLQVRNDLIAAIKAAHAKVANENPS